MFDGYSVSFAYVCSWILTFFFVLYIIRVKHDLIFINLTPIFYLLFLLVKYRTFVYKGLVSNINIMYFKNNRYNFHSFFMKKITFTYIQVNCVMQFVLCYQGSVKLLLFLYGPTHFKLYFLFPNISISSLWDIL